MDGKCLLVDFAESEAFQEWEAKLEGQELPLEVIGVTAEEAEKVIEEGDVVSMVCFVDETSEQLANVLGAYRRSVGAIGAFQGVVCGDPSPMFMAAVFEYGIETFFSEESWAADVAAFGREINEVLQDEESSEAKAIAMNRAIRAADQEKIKEIAQKMDEAANYDFLAAYSKGKALEATGDFDAAVEAFKSSNNMNKMFRPTSSSLCDNLLVTGRVDEAVGILEKMERSNPNDAGRKATLAAAYVEKGDFEKAKEYAAAAAKLEPNSSRTVEAKAQILLASGKVGEAFKLMDNISEAGPLFAAKLNEMGIKLSQTGKGKSALALYQKAHKIVRPELKYKISMNAALACHRMNAFTKALKYIDRCEKEYGSSFEKAEKIRKVLKKKIAGAKKAAGSKPAA